MQKQSDSSLRSRNALPTIAGSPSVATTGTNGVSKEAKEPKEPPPSSLSNSVSGSLPKETPTKIPRISSRTSTVGSPMQKGGISRRTSVTVGGLSSSTNPSPTGVSTNEFGVMESEDSHGAKTVSGPTRTASVRGSPATVSTSRVPRQSTATTASSSSSVLTRKSNRDSISFTGLRKSSTSSVTSSSTAAAAESSSTHHRFSALSPSRGLNKLLSPKIGLASARASNSTSSIQQVANSPSSSRQSLTAQSPSPAPSSIDDEEAQGDEEMMHYIRRQQAKKMAAGATQEDLDELLNFPEPLPPGTPSTPQGLLCFFR